MRSSWKVLVKSDASKLEIIYPSAAATLNQLWRSLKPNYTTNGSAIQLILSRPLHSQWQLHDTFIKTLYPCKTIASTRNSSSRKICHTCTRCMRDQQDESKWVNRGWVWMAKQAWDWDRVKVGQVLMSLIELEVLSTWEVCVLELNEWKILLLLRLSKRSQLRALIEDVVHCIMLIAMQIEGE